MNLDINALIKDFILEYRTAKNLFITGVMLLTLSYIIDHWGTASRTLFLGVNIPNTIYPIGIFLLLISTIYITALSFCGVIRSWCYRYNYSRKNLDDTFHAFNFGGKAYILDIKKKEHHWISSWQTAEDCDFHDLWTVVGDSFESNLTNNPKVTTVGGITVDITQYRKNGGKIHTRGIIGT
ncbi:MAG TPA: hypothetical protein VEP90_25035 [Methylomirabilota bacterium]|nr:hypothetical protein [Methylomirabilota bacterium]